MPASNFETLEQTLLGRLTGLGALPVILRKTGIKLTKDSTEAIYLAPVGEKPINYAFNHVVIVEYSFDVVVVKKGDQQLGDQSNPSTFSLQPQIVEKIRNVLDVGGFPEIPTINESRWEPCRLYDRQALANNYDKTAMRFYYKSDEVRS